MSGARVVKAGDRAAVAIYRASREKAVAQLASLGWTIVASDAATPQ
jgi:hypothetical protein